MGVNPVNRNGSSVTISVTGGNALSQVALSSGAATSATVKLPPGSRPISKVETNGAARNSNDLRLLQRQALVVSQANPPAGRTALTPPLSGRQTFPAPLNAGISRTQSFPPNVSVEFEVPAAARKLVASLADRQTSLKTGTQSASQLPEAWVFENGFGAGGIDIDGDGMGDVGHGEIVSGVIFGKTGIPVNKVQAEENVEPTQILTVLDAMLQRKDVSNLYLNFSISTANDAAVYQRLTRLADRGAHIYIAAGNAAANGLASAGPPRPNIHVVGASAQSVGSTVQSTKLQTIKIPEITQVVNGLLIPSKVSGGVDLTEDGKADIPSALVNAIPNDAAGRQLSEVDLTSAVLKQGRLLSDEEKPPANGVVSVKVLREKGLISSDNLKLLQERSNLTTNQLDKLYLHAQHLQWYELSFRDEGGMVLYQPAGDGKLEVVRQKTSLDAATSWATPNAMARDMNLAIAGQPLKSPQP